MCHTLIYMWNYFCLGWCHMRQRELKSCPTSVPPAFNVHCHFSWKLSFISQQNIFLGISAHIQRKEIWTAWDFNKDSRPTSVAQTHGTCSSWTLRQFFLLIFLCFTTVLICISFTNQLADFADSTASSTLQQYPWQQDKLVALLCCVQCMFAAVESELF